MKPSEMTRLKRDIAELREVVELRLGARTPMSASDRQSLKSEIESCMQTLDELRERLGSFRP